MSSGFDGNAPDHEQNGRQLILAAKEARHSNNEIGNSPVERQTIREMMEAEWPPILDDTSITPSAEPHQTAERVSTRPRCSFDL